MEKPGEKITSESPESEEEEQEKFMEIFYRMVFESSKDNGIVTDEVSFEDFREAGLKDALKKLKEKGVKEFTIQW